MRPGENGRRWGGLGVGRRGRRRGSAQVGGAGGDRLGAGPDPQLAENPEDVIGMVVFDLDRIIVGWLWSDLGMTELARRPVSR